MCILLILLHKSRKILFRENGSEPRAIAIDLHNKCFVWSDFRYSPRIERVLLDGSEH